ncbi:MAG TPA: hypothetical protein PKU70_03880 [Vicinamibacteria bacterium]|nr:hypothetical protein [Vicinamibacteria bacterium]
MMRSLRVIGSSCALGAILSAAIPAAVLAQAEAPPRPFLRQAIGLTDAQLAALEKGEAVIKQLTTTEKAEVAAFGVVKVKGTQDAFLQKIKQIHVFRKVPEVLQIGRFSAVPTVADLQGLTWEPADLDALKRCKPGQCDVKIGTAGLERLQKEIDWPAKDAPAKAEALIKDQLIAHVKAYMAGGTAAMGQIVDKKQPKALSEEFRALLRNSPYLPAYIPEFNQYLEDYPNGKLAGAEDVLYWTKDNFGLKPVVSITHATFWKRTGPQAGTIVALKTLYASHFFNASLEMIVAVDTPDRTGFYLMNLYRTRIDPPTGMLSGVLMGRVKSGVEQGVRENLKTAKARMEGK